MRLLLTLQYLGTRYAGWQSQANAVAIQTVLEEALARIYGTEIRVEGGGRTDSGVHAAGQRVHYDAPTAITPRGLILGLNNLLPHDIRVSQACEVASDFHCRFQAIDKSYAYRIWTGPVMNPFAWETHTHVATPLDIEAMRRAADPLLGAHDFRAFTVAEPEVSSTTRRVTSISVAASLPRSKGGVDWVSDKEESGSPGMEKGTAGVITIRISADGFLRNMVRRIAGSLIEVGSGRLDPSALERSLEPHFEPARWTAPAKGLVLEEIRY